MITTRRTVNAGKRRGFSELNAFIPDELTLSEDPSYREFLVVEAALDCRRRHRHCRRLYACKFDKSNHEPGTRRAARRTHCFSLGAPKTGRRARTSSATRRFCARDSTAPRALPLGVPYSRNRL